MSGVDLNESGRRLAEVDQLAAPPIDGLIGRANARRRRRRAGLVVTLVATSGVAFAALAQRAPNSEPVTAAGPATSSASSTGEEQGTATPATETPAPDHGDPPTPDRSHSRLDLSITRSPYDEERAAELRDAADETYELDDATVYVSRSATVAEVAVVTDDSIIVMRQPPDLIPDEDAIRALADRLLSGTPMIIGPDGLRDWPDIDRLLPEGLRATMPDELRELLERGFDGELPELRQLPDLDELLDEWRGIERLPSPDDWDVERWGDLDPDRFLERFGRDPGELFGDRWREGLPDLDRLRDELEPGFGFLGWDVGYLPEGYQHAGGGLDLRGGGAGFGLRASCIFANADGDTIEVTAARATSVDDELAGGQPQRVRGHDGWIAVSGATQELSWVEDGTLLSIEAPAGLPRDELIEIAEGLERLDPPGGLVLGPPWLDDLGNRDEPGEHPAEVTSV